MKQPNENAIAALALLLSDANIPRLYKCLVRMLIDYLFYHTEGLPTDFENMLDDLEKLLSFLAVIERHK